jgi:two-component system sensor histidine kinase YesM
MALQEKNYQLKSSELLALQAQINPHFLVNTLNTVFWKALALTGGPNEVSSMIEDFTQLLAQLMGDPNECVPLSEEMRCLQSYIDIQKRRFPDRFTYTTNIDPVIGDAAILKLILQPIVENCISHALVPEREINIQVDVCVRGDSIELTVKDDGAGMTAEVLERLRVPSDQHQYKHIGLYNTMKRLALFYNVDSPLTIDSCEGNGTIVRISVPMI